MIFLGIQQDLSKEWEGFTDTVNKKMSTFSILFPKIPEREKFF